MTAAAASATTTNSGLSRNLMEGLDCQTAQTSSGWLQVAKKLVKMELNYSKARSFCMVSLDPELLSLFLLLISTRHPFGAQNGTFPNELKRKL